MNILIEPHYLPSIEYFTILSKADKVYIEQFDNFQKQSYRNRSYILTANKVDRLTVPVKGANKGLPMRKMLIDNESSRWQDRHWRAIYSAYARAPFFEHYADYFKELIYAEHEHLYELNWKSLTLCHKLLGLKCQLVATTSSRAEIDDNTIDLRGVLHPRNNHGIENVSEYLQVFGDGFIPNMSIIDMIFCEGPQSIMHLKQQMSKHIFV